MYSRRLVTEEKRNKKKAILYIFLSILSVLFIFIYGLPAIARFASFLMDLRQTSEPVESSDTTAPPPPKLEPLPKSTNKQRLDIQGSTEPGAIVTVFYNDKNENVVANSDGNFSFNAPLNKGENSFSVSAKDSSGNESQKTEEETVLFDDTPPELEITKPKDGSDFFGNLQRQITIEGKTEEETQVQINSRQVVVENDQTFSYFTSLSQGSNTFTIKAQDTAGNITEKTLTVNFTP